MKDFKALPDNYEPIVPRHLAASAEVHRKLDANEEDLAFRWLAARRDYPYDLSLRVRPSYVHPVIFERCLREFSRSNPGFEL